MQLSVFGTKFAGDSGIVELMDDLGTALVENPGMIMMGGGNPGRLPEAEALFQKRLEAVLSDPEKRHSLFGLYQSTQGDLDFRKELASYLRKQFGWRLSERNIAISNGSQPAFFVLLNMFAGEMPDGGRRSIHLPLTPEYLGYADSGLSEDFFTATRPEIELLDGHLFKYHVDFSRLDVGTGAGALCVSRPTNPTGNVLTDEEVAHLDALAKECEIPFILDGAYGLPFPGIIFTRATPHWNENTILVLSLSKLGLPGVRTGIIVAREEIIRAYANANGIVNLACGNIGPAIATELFRSGEIGALTRSHVAPFYHDRATKTVAAFRQALGDLPYRIHKPEGAFFLWLWFEGLPISSQRLYQRLKRRGVLVVPGHHCFFGLQEEWPHRHECLRISYVQSEDQVRRGIAIIADEVSKAYAGGA
ncbi:MAG: valine--pyruvate transaminase [Xanthomonadales bacterium]|nr:valine--pyruvate transaminase [Gammaproteobacteria bacterium]MBT8053133.1 valine--pyruvate transaminase [Gammaproteobacteria bacterium]NND56215.1 valine--pyruvate transaminase [Xanthomonadales bacterium]NNK52290.1 valine--pyruvate transaminase [Xanthomonadales bacterium]